jgi:hypothetical protein
VAALDFTVGERCDLTLHFSKPGSTPMADYAGATERERAVMNDAGLVGACGAGAHGA